MKCLEGDLYGGRGHCRLNRVNLYCSKTLLNILSCPRCSTFGVSEQAALHRVIGGGVKVRIGPEFFVNLSSEQVVDWLVKCLTNDVLKSHFKGADYTHHCQVRMLAVTSGIECSPHPFNLEWVRVDDKPFTDKINQTYRGMRVKGYSKSHTQAIYAHVGDPFEE